MVGRGILKFETAPTTILSIGNESGCHDDADHAACVTVWKHLREEIGRDAFKN